MAEKLKAKTRRRSSVLVISRDRILGFRAIDPTSHQAYFFVPGGGIEQNETPQAAAIRETLEETGYLIAIAEQEPVISHYPFTWDGQKFLCETYFYKAELDPPKQIPQLVVDADYHKGVEWIHLVDLEKEFAYSDDVRLALKKLLGRVATT